jgi:hypothetical protein
VLLTYVVHIFAGSLALLAGFVALYAAKGAPLHRRSGMVFVFAMLTMAVGGFVIATVRGVAPDINVPAAVLTSYLVITGLTTIRPLPDEWRWLSLVLLLVALGVGFADAAFAFEAFANGGKRNDMPAFPYVMFGVVAFLGSVGDMRMLRSGPPQGAQRLARHLWRMCFALFIAALSFFIGQAQSASRRCSWAGAPLPEKGRPRSSRASRSTCRKCAVPCCSV